MDFNFKPAEDNKNPLGKYARNINNDVINNKIDPIIGREDEIRRIIEIISRKTKNNPILIGEPGVGKTAIVEGMAQRIVNGDVPEQLIGKEIYELSLSSLVAGTQYRGEFENRLNAIIKQVGESSGKIILFIDEIHQLVGAGGVNEGTMDAANILKPQMARGDIKLIGATTFDEYRKYIEKDRALERRMQKVIVNEPTVSEALTILRGLKERWELFHKVKIHDVALVTAVKLADRYITSKFLPDKAIDLVDEAAAKVKTAMYSLPSELDKINRMIVDKETERISLSTDTDPLAKKRLSAIEDELKKIKAQQKKAHDAWYDQKQQHDKLIALKVDIENARNRVDRLQAEGKYEQASKLLYVEIPNLEKQVFAMEEANTKSTDSVFSDAVGANEIASVISRATGIPLTKLVAEEKEKLIHLEDELKLRVKGQDKAIKNVANAVLRSRAGINDPARPIGSFLFLGPTGVGKTELAKALAANLFDTEKCMVRFDMSEYAERYEVSKLIGAAPGYVGFNENGGSGSLTNAIKNHPYSVLLFDEIEKAHPNVLNVLLQVLDDGRLTDAQGNVVNFKNVIIIMTSNLGAQEILDGKPTEAIKTLKTFLRPEFINRIDEIINFNPIDEKTIVLIVEKLLNDLKVRLENENILIDFSDKAIINRIAKDAYDPVFGARPIKRYIQSKIENLLAQNILETNIKKGINYRITVNKTGTFEFLPKKDD